MRSPGAIALVGIVGALTLAPASAGADEPPSASKGGPERNAVQAPSRKRGSTVARIVAPTIARASLKLPRGTGLSTQTVWSGQQQRLLVLDARSRDGREWLKVLLPFRPNGSAGWILRDKVVLERSRYWVDVRTGARRVSVYRDGKRVRRFRVVVGKPATPTPTGLAAIYERNRQPNAGGFLGPWALSLTIHSKVLKNYGGGPGRVGIHGRAGASLRDPLGSARSHGCIRVHNRHISWLARKVPAGTPVRIRR